MASVANVFNTDNAAFRTYIFYCCVLGIKMLLMSFLTASKRIQNKAFANPEDAATMKLKPRTDDKVERVRRAHLNDLENIILFMIISSLYLLTNPAPVLAINLIRVFAAARIVHTLVYAVVVVPQPARGLSWGIGYAITVYMAFMTGIHFFTI